MDIISLSFGCSKEDYSITAAIKSVLAKGIIVLAATHNKGANVGIKFPASMRGVFCIGAANGFGKLAPFTPEEGKSEMYSTLGVFVPVPAIHPKRIEIRNQYYREDGASLATPIAAGIAALCLEYHLRFKPIERSVSTKTKFVREMFIAMSKTTEKQSYRYLAPWTLLKPGQTWENLQATLNQLQTESWLLPRCPLYNEMRTMLDGARNQRGESLLWAAKTDEFQKWKTGELVTTPRVLWVYGPPGIGKTTMAASFVDNLTSTLGKTLVGYFFCKRGETRASNIISTLACQFAKASAPVRWELDEIKEYDRQLEPKESGGIEGLFMKFINKPLKETSHVVFIILDGLDEADWGELDCVRKDKSEMAVLLQCFGDLTEIRLLVTSRPDLPVPVPELLPNSITREIKSSDNGDDIREYVRKQLIKTPILVEYFHEYFQDAEKDPVTEILTRSNGIFLWVVIIFPALSKVRDQETFNELFAIGASTGMNVLWQTVLKNVPPTDEAWVKEVLRWILIANNMSIRDLKSVVEWARKRTFKPEGEFKKFLESECGSLLQLIRLDNGETEARLIHETLRSLLFDQGACKTTFAFDKKAIRCDAVLEFLRRLEEAEKTLPKYLSLNWSHLLSLVVESESLSDELLSALHQSFVNESWTTWVQFGLIEHGRSTSLLHWGIGFDYPQMHDIVYSLKQWKGDDNTKLETPKAAAIKWKQGIINHPGILGQCVGQAAAKIWLYEDHVKFRNAAMAFYLALKYYLRRERHWWHSQNSVKELRELVASEFHGIIIWAGRTERIPKPKNIGIAFAFLRQWDHAIAHYRSVPDAIANNDPRLSEYLGNAYHAKGDKDEELNAYKRASEINPKRWRPWAYLSFAYSANGDEKNGILMYEKAVEKDPTRSWPGYKTFIQDQQQPVNFTDWWPWPYFEGKDYAIRVPTFIRGRLFYPELLVYYDIETDRRTLLDIIYLDQWPEPAFRQVVVTLLEKLPETYLEVSGWPEPFLQMVIKEKVISSLSLVLIS